jgi:hypothetical protein
VNARYLVDTDWDIDYLNGLDRTRKPLEELADGARPDFPARPPKWKFANLG